MPLKIVLVDDHHLVRQGLHAVLQAQKDFQIVHQTGDGAEAIQVVDRLRPDVLVLDLMLSGLSGLDVAREVSRRCPWTRIVFLSMHGEVAYVAEAFRAGACGYVLKEDGIPDLVKAIREAAQGNRFLSPGISETALFDYTERAKSSGGEEDPLHVLTLREREVFQLTAEGLSGTAVGERLYISSRTVESHRVNLMKKLGLRNLKELIRFAVRRGMLPDD